MAMDQPRLFADTIAPVCRANATDLFLLSLEAKPEPDCADYGQVGGAFVNCWVDADDLRSAELRAVALIEEHGWRPHRFDSWEVVNRATYADRASAGDNGIDCQELIEQAFVDGEVCVFHTWPIGGTDVE